MKPEKIDSSMAEKWLDPDTFIYKGKIYRLYGLKVKEIEKEGINGEENGQPNNH